MPSSIKAIRLVNLLLGGGITNVQLQTELGTAMTKGAFIAALNQGSVQTELSDSTVAMGIFSGSALAVTAMMACPSFLAVIAGSVNGSSTVAASSAAMTQIAANTKALTAFFGNGVARASLYASDTALATFANSTTRDILRSLPGYVSKSISNGSSINAVSLGLTGSAISFEEALSGAGNITINGRRAGSSQGTVTAHDPSATSLPGDSNVIALQSTATVATSTATARTSYFGLIYV
jgi:hypothetical protein